MHVLRIEKLTKIYKLAGHTFTALSALDLSIEQGEVFGFLGPNGAGKTTTIKILVNLIFPTSGKAWIFGDDCSLPEARRRIGFLPEMPMFYDYLTLEELLRFGGETAGLSKALIKTRIDHLLVLLDMERARNLRIRKFSKGMQQRAGLAYALMGDPDVLILDEPMSGLDPIGRKDFVDLIRKLKAEGKTIFFSSHVLSDIENLCDRVGILVKGELKKVGNVSELLRAEDGFLVRVSGLDGGGKEYLEQLGVHVSVDGNALSLRVTRDKVMDVMDIIKARKASIASIDTMRKSLEDIFMEVVQQNQSSVSPTPSSPHA